MEKLDIIGKSNTLSKKEISKLIKNTFIQLNNKLKSTIEIKFVPPQEMKELNLKHRKVNNPTDVISFPQTTIPGNKQVLGSIVICEQYSEKIGGSTEELIKHGILHLLGFDHEANQKKWIEAAKLVNHNML